MSDYQPPSYPTIVALLRNRASILKIAPAAVALVFFWLGFRWSSVDIALLGVVFGVAVYYALRVAIEVVALVADTLLPK